MFYRRGAKTQGFAGESCVKSSTMDKALYDTKAEALGRAIDLGIESVQKYPPKGFNQRHLDQVVHVYMDYKRAALCPEPKFRNKQSLRQIEHDILTYFQEASGDAVEYFWKQIKDQGLSFKRENKLEKILKRGKIKNQMEYDFIVDVLVPYQQEGLITQTDADLLGQMLAQFEQRSRK
jgi:hypothetical protein